MSRSTGSRSRRSPQGRPRRPGRPFLCAIRPSDHPTIRGGGGRPLSPSERGRILRSSLFFKGSREETQYGRQTAAPIYIDPPGVVIFCLVGKSMEEEVHLGGHFVIFSLFGAKENFSHMGG